MLKEFLQQQDKYEGWRQQLSKVVVDGETVLWVCKRCLDEKQFAANQRRQRKAAPRPRPQGAGPPRRVLQRKHALCQCCPEGLFVLALWHAGWMPALAPPLGSGDRPGARQ